MNIQSRPLIDAFNAAYAKISRHPGPISKEDAARIVESIQLAVKPSRLTGPVEPVLSPSSQ